MTGVYAKYRGAVSKVTVFETRSEAEKFASWVRATFRYDAVVVVPV